MRLSPFRLATTCLFFLALTATGTYAQEKPKAANVRPVAVTKVKKTTFADRIEALGTLHANESVTLTATVTDTVTAVNFNDGQRVEAGTILAEMTSAQEKAMLEEERSTAEEARRQLDRIRPLAKQGAASESLLDQRRRAMVREGREASLTAREFALARVLFERAGDVCTRTELLASVWGPNFDGEPNVVDVYAGYLRRKLAELEAATAIRTVRGVGFRLEPA